MLGCGMRYILTEILHALTFRYRNFLTGNEDCNVQYVKVLRISRSLIYERFFSEAVLVWGEVSAAWLKVYGGQSLPDS
jgi:hypothetical protein